MKNILKTALFGLAGLALTTCIMGYSRPSSADETVDQTPPTQQQHHHHHRGGFMLGVCVGQTLAKAGVTLPATPGDQTTHAAFQSAIEGCRAQFKNKAPSSNNS